MSDRPTHVLIDMGDGTAWVQRLHPLRATDDVLTCEERVILHLHEQVERLTARLRELDPDGACPAR